MNVLMITVGKFPSGDAGAVRMEIFSKMLTDNGSTVTAISRTEKNTSKENLNIYSTRGNSASKIVKLFEYFLFPKRAKAIIKANAPYDAVYVYNVPIRLFVYLKKYCKKQNIPLVHDCVEWYSASEFKAGFFSLAYLEKDIINRFVIDKNVKVISISKYLEEYFTKKGITTVRIPILADMTDECEKKLEKDSARIMYAGSPGKKDLIGNAVKAYFALSREEREKLKLLFIGTGKKQISELSGIGTNKLQEEKNIIILPRIPRDEVLEKFGGSDFIILPRNSAERYAKAGFPSKVVEALAHKTPILCNYSSDLADYLTDGENSVIAADHTPDAICAAYKRIIGLSLSEREKLQENAFSTAKKYFCYKLFEKSFLDFLEK